MRTGIQAMPRSDYAATTDSGLPFSCSLGAVEENRGVVIPRALCLASILKKTLQVASCASPFVDTLRHGTKISRANGTLQGYRGGSCASGAQARAKPWTGFPIARPPRRWHLRVALGGQSAALARALASDPAAVDTLPYDTRRTTCALGDAITLTSSSGPGAATICRRRGVPPGHRLTMGLGSAKRPIHRTRAT